VTAGRYGRDVPALIEVVRGGEGSEWVESVHRGGLVLVEPSGSIGADAALLPRSALKPLQAIALLEAGFIGRGPSLALALASHDGEAIHIDGVRGTLAEAGLDEALLQCPPALPGNEAALADWLRLGQGPAPIAHNCSGKHAAMLATCVAAGWPLESYRDPSHPLQSAIRDRIESLTGVGVCATVVDGCGAPAFAVTLAGLAAAFAELATASSGPSAMVANAMRRHPVLVAGTTQTATLAMTAVPGLICKDGAEGVWAAALPDGRGFAAKFDDGAARGLPVLLAAVLQRWGVPAETLTGWGEVPVLGGGVGVGALRVSEELRELLAT
jgi:L-asparaginase II